MNLSPRAISYPVAIGVLSAAVLGWSLYRAADLDLTHDEAITYLRFVSGGPRTIYDPVRYDANNHVLYSSLAWASTRLFGVNELALRLPAVLAGGFVVVAAGRFFRVLAGPTPLAFGGVLVVVLHPLVLDFLVAARGYGLGLGLSLWAWASLMKALPINTRPELLSAGITQGLAVGANLVFVFPNLAFAVVFLGLKLYRNRWPLSPIAGRLVTCYILPGAVTAALLSFPIFRHLGGEHFYYGAESLFGTAESFVDPLLPAAEGSAWVRTATGATLVVLAASLVPSFSVITGIRRSVGRGGESTFVDAMIYGGVVGILVLVLLTHIIAGTPYPQDRTGIYFIPLGTACLVLGLKRRPWLAVVGTVLLGLLAIYSTS